MSYQHALTTLQWSTDPEKEGYGDCMEFEASKDLIKKIEDDWNSFDTLPSGLQQLPHHRTNHGYLNE